MRLNKFRTYFMVCLFLFLMVAFFSRTANAATYCVRQGGTASATTTWAYGSTESTTTCMSMSTHNGATFQPGDTIYLSDTGGNFSVDLIPPSNGSDASNLITYDRASSTGNPTIVGLSSCFAVTVTSSRSFLSINNLTISPTNSSASCRGIRFMRGDYSNISFNSINFSMSAGGRLVSADNTTSLTDISITNSTGTATLTATHPAMSFESGTSTNLTLSNINITGGGALSIANATGTTSIYSLSRNIINGVGLQVNNSFGTLSIDNFTASSSTSHGLYILNSTFSSGSKVSNSNISSSTGYCYDILSAHNISFESNTSTNATSHGFAISGAHDLTFTSNVAISGSRTAAGSNGFYVLGTSYNLTFSSNTASSFPGAGFSVSGSSHDITFNADNITSPASTFVFDTVSNITLSNISVSGGSSFTFSTVSGLTLQNVTHNNSTVYGATITNGSGSLSVSGFTANSPSLAGLYIASSTFSVGSLVSNSSISSAGTYSYYLNNISNLSLTSNSASNSVDHFFVIASSTNLTFTSNTITGGSNGTSTQTGFYIIATSTNLTFNSNISYASKASGFVIKEGSHGIRFNSDISDASVSSVGFSISDGAYDVVCTSCIARNNGDDGFSTTDNVHDVTFNKCLSYNNGIALNTSGGDGFTSHKNNYNIFITNSLSYNNIQSGFAMSGESQNGPNSAGHIYNSVAAGSTGAGPRNIGGFGFTTQNYNTSTGPSLGWIIRNSIGHKNTPREVEALTNALTNWVDLDYNVYKPISDSAFYSSDLADARNATTSWSDYSAYEPNSLNAGANQVFISNSPSTTTDFRLYYLSPAIDSGDSSILTSTSTDYDGNPIYGTPDIGAFEYQPPYTITSNNPQYSGNIRIYADGKYRYTTATSSVSAAKLTITPLGGSYNSYDASTTRPEYMNISSITWGSTKQWTASSSIATTTIYTIGDLTPNTNYTVTLDGSATSTITSSACTGNICTADSSGYITLTYTGGYSTHTFTLTPVPAATVSGGGLPPAAFLPPQKPAITTDNPTGEFKAIVISTNTALKQVTLKLVAGADTIRMAISEDPNFVNVAQEPFTATTTITLKSNTTKLYIKFYNQFGQASEVVMASLGQPLDVIQTIPSGAPIASGLVIVKAGVGQIIKVGNKNRPAVYYVLDGYKYLFVNRQTYTTWSTAAGDTKNNFATLKIITQAEFDAIPLGSNVTAQPGSLIQFDDNSSIYAVGTGAKLYKLADNKAQTALYGTLKPIIVQSGFRDNYFNHGNPVATLTATSQKPE